MQELIGSPEGQLIFNSRVEPFKHLKQNFVTLEGLASFHNFKASANQNVIGILLHNFGSPDLRPQRCFLNNGGALCTLSIGCIV